MERLQSLLGQAQIEIGRLDGMRFILPAPDGFTSASVRREAVLSSRLAGGQASLSDLLRFEHRKPHGRQKARDAAEASNYLAAMDHGRRRLAGGFAVSNRLLRTMHQILSCGGGGRQKLPGEFRVSQVRIDGVPSRKAEFVPPPPDRIPRLMSDFEEFLRQEAPGIPPLVKAGLTHVQFGTIHPFRHGNGRLGRLLIALVLLESGFLAAPLLCPSLYFRQHRSEYHDRLHAVRFEGDWEGWLRFFLEGIRESSRLAVETIRRLSRLFDEDRQRIEGLGRKAPSALRIHRLLQRRMAVSIPEAAADLGRAPMTAIRSLRHLDRLGIASEITGKHNHRLYAYPRYLEIVAEGTEPSN